MSHTASMESCVADLDLLGGHVDVAQQRRGRLAQAGPEHRVREVGAAVGPEHEHRLAGGQAAEFRKAHGPSANGMAFRVADAKAAFELATKNGAHPADPKDGLLGEGSYVLQGIGGSLLYLVDRYGAKGSLYEQWTPIAGAAEAEARRG